MPTLCCNGVELHVERAGQGPRLLYCNGSGATLAAVPWLLNRLAERFDVVAFDYRGMGASAPISEPYAMADAAADVAGLLDAFGWERTAMLGWSFGGMVAQEFAVSFPERLERLALLSTSPGGPQPAADGPALDIRVAGGAPGRCGPGQAHRWRGIGWPE